MFIALDRFGKKTTIDDAQPAQPYFCQRCHAKLIPKRGEIRAHHFSHKPSLRNGAKRNPCVDKWNYDKTAWHYNWQKQFPVECIEFVIEKNRQKHLADVLVNNLVVEFQHSAISMKNYQERNEFYNACGYSVIWVFDLIEEFSNEIICCIDDNNRYSWGSPGNLFSNPAFDSENVTVYFQFSDKESGKHLFRVKKGYRGYTTFFSDRNRIFTVNEFVQTALNNPEMLVAPHYSANQEIVKKGKTIFDLWSPEYSYMIVTNLDSSKDMLVRGIEGNLICEKGDTERHILGKYSNLGKDGKYYYSENEYVIWDAEKPTWELKYSLLLKDDKVYLAKKQEADQRRRQYEESIRIQREQEEKRLQAEEDRKKAAEEREKRAWKEWEEKLPTIDLMETQARDLYGRRWVKCRECGSVKLADKFSSYGGSGKNMNLGVCNECSRKNRT